MCRTLYHVCILAMTPLSQKSEDPEGLTERVHHTGNTASPSIGPAISSRTGDKLSYRAHFGEFYEADKF